MMLRFSRRSTLGVSSLLILLLAVSALPARSTSAHVAASLSGKKTCKKVSKTVNGKKKLVTVCKPSKPRPTATPKPTVVSIPTAPNPVSVTIQRQNTGAVSKVFGNAGGTLSLTTAAGVAISLTVPSGALPADTTVTITPVSAVGGLPLSGGLVAAVQFEPEGLRFYKPATLTFNLPTAIPVARQLGFTATGSGAEFHLYPQTFESSRITMSLLHFSTYGVGQGTMTDVVTASQHPPTSWEAQTEQLQALVDKAKQATDSGQTSPIGWSEVAKQLEQSLRSRYQQVVLPEMERAATSDDEAFVKQAIQDAISLMRTAELAGISLDKESARLRDLMRQALLHQLALAKQRCGTGLRRLAYAPPIGWLIDVEGMNKILELSRTGLLLFSDDPGFVLAMDDKSLAPCRPRGLKFEHVKWHVQLHAADVAYGPSTSDFEILLGRACGRVVGLAWVFTTHEVSNWPLYGNHQFDGVYDVYWVPEHLTFSTHVAGPTQTAWIEQGLDPKIHIRVQAPPKNVDMSPADQTMSAPIVEDTTCPPVP